MDKVRKLPPVGLRIIKSAVVVFLCYIVYILRGKQGIVFYSQLAALWCMQPYIRNSMNMAIQRTTGTLIGAAYGLVVILIYENLFPKTDQFDVIYYLLVSLMIVVVLYTTIVIKKKNASYFSTVVFLSIVVVHIGDADPVLFTLNRVLDTMIGIVLAVIVNMFRIPRRKQKDILFVSGVDDTLVNEKEVLSPFSKIELNRMLQEGANFTVSTMRTPASIMDALGDIQWKLPLIVMDGAALYDMKERKYLVTRSMKKSMVRELLSFFDQHHLNCFVNIVIDSLLVISYKDLKNDAERRLYHDLRRSPYRNFVRADLLSQGDVLYLMMIGEKQQMQGIFSELQKQECYGELKVCVYDSINYPGYTYMKIYDRNATRDQMMEVLKEHTGLTKAVTFGSIDGKYDVVVKKNDSDRVVKTLERMYEPFFWSETAGKIKKCEKK